jgi:hypothetical protein
LKTLITCIILEMFSILWLTIEAINKFHTQRDVTRQYLALTDCKEIQIDEEITYIHVNLVKIILRTW